MLGDTGNSELHPFSFFYQRFPRTGCVWPGGRRPARPGRVPAAEPALRRFVCTGETQMTRLTSMLVLCYGCRCQQALAATVTFQAVNGVGSLSIGRGTTPAEVANDPSLAGRVCPADFRVIPTAIPTFSPRRRCRAGERRGSSTTTRPATDTEPPLDAFVAVFPRSTSATPQFIPGTDRPGRSRRLGMRTATPGSIRLMTAQRTSCS